MNHLQQGLMKVVVVEGPCAGINGVQVSIDDKEGFIVCLVGLAKNHPLRAVPLRSSSYIVRQKEAIALAKRTGIVLS